DLEVGVHLGVGYDRGQERGAGPRLHEIAERDLDTTDPAGDRGLDIGVVEIDARLAQLGLRRSPCRLRDLQGILPLVVEAPGDDPPLQERCGTFEVGGGEREIRLRGIQRRLRARDRRLVGRRVDDEENLARFDRLAILYPYVG